MWSRTHPPRGSRRERLIVVPLFSLTPLMTQTHFSGCVPGSRDVLRAILANPAGYYVNIHTTVFPLALSVDNCCPHPTRSRGLMPAGLAGRERPGPTCYWGGAGPRATAPVLAESQSAHASRLPTHRHHVNESSANRRDAPRAHAGINIDSAGSGRQLPAATCGVMVL